MNTTSINSFNYITFTFTSSIIITVMAIIGNSTVLFILTKPQFKKKSLFRYLFIATIFDAINALYTWLYNYQDFFMINQNELICKLIHYFGHVTYLFNPWINVFISIDTFMAVKFPIKFQVRNTYKFQIVIIICLVISLFLVNIPYLMYLKITQYGGNYGCAADSNEAILLNLYITILLITNCLIFYHLVVARKSSNQNGHKNATRLFFVSLGMNFFFLIFYSPYRITMIFFNYNYLPLYVFNILFLLESIYNSCNFVIYIISNRLFREQCKSLISCSVLSFRRKSSFS